MLLRDLRVSPDVERHAELVHAARKHEHRIDRVFGLRLDRPLRDGDDHDARAARDLADLFRDVKAGDLALQERVDHHDVRLLGRHLRDRGLGLRLHARELDLVLARKHLLKMLRDLGQVLYEEDSFHRGEFRSLRRASRNTDSAARARAAARNEAPTRSVMPSQYQSGYKRTMLLVAGSKRKLPCGKNT